MKGRATPYSAAELDWIAANARLLVAPELHAGFCAIFGRDDVSSANLTALRKRKGWLTGRTGRFVKGTEPPNKGKPMPYHPNSAATRFKKGNRTGRANHLHKPVGFERLSKEGYRERKVHDGMPLQSRWRAVHLIEWEALNGKLPEGHALKCLDGDRANTSPANWQLVPRAMLPRLAGGNRYHRRLAYDEAPPELKPAVLAAARLDHAARQARRKAGHDEVTT